jgi:hypothetical protein
MINSRGWLRIRGEGTQGQFVKTDRDTLATGLYVKADDLLRESPPLAPFRPEVGIGPKLSDAEMVTLAVMQALLGFTSLRPAGCAMPVLTCGLRLHPAGPARRLRPGRCQSR